MRFDFTEDNFELHRVINLNYELLQYIYFRLSAVFELTEDFHKSVLISTLISVNSNTRACNYCTIYIFTLFFYCFIFLILNNFSANFMAYLSHFCCISDL